MVGSNQRTILLDAQHIVVADSKNEVVGNQFSAAQAQNGAAITINNKVVGTILVTPNNFTGAGTPAGEFLSSVNRAIISSAILAGVIALILGSILFVQITAPLRKLKQATAAIGKGDLSQRVQIQSHDEFADLGQSFNHMAESLADAETQRRHLMADVAHELRTPLTAIQGTLEAMQDRILPLDDEGIEALYSQTLLLNRLISDLRLLSLAEAGQLKLDKTKIDPAALIQQITDGLKPLARQKNIQLGIEIQPNLTPVSLDSDRIAQVLNNLISNAIRYTPEGGLITVQASKPSDKSSLLVSVTDTGAGVDSVDLPYIFDRFYRADKSRTRTSGGSGLGLAIVKQLVEAHGGHVWAESPVFQDQDQKRYGTRICFILPL
jgi:signal transduction histidine kinase